MNRRSWTLLIIALALIGGAAALLARLQGIQKLGRPAVKTSPIPGSNRLKVELPARVLDYTSEESEPDQRTLDWLPADTSFGQRLYRAPDDFMISVGVVLMGSDRTSLHKTEFCIEGAGWRIDRGATAETQVHLERPYPYDLPLMKFIGTREGTFEGQPVRTRGIYLVWFVADNNEYTARHWQRMWWMARDLLTHGVLQRWAAISVLAACAPGQEDATFERMKTFLQAAVPEFQLVPRRPDPAAPAAP
ncbi:MAG TPA: exosortase-associated EpsI family protein [Candidatus Paceibacterota bacterium]|nr:exosortase-associated EpsI family protein [Candidatus Paceibacterota bacterium]